MHLKQINGHPFRSSQAGEKGQITIIQNIGPKDSSSTATSNSNEKSEKVNRMFRSYAMLGGLLGLLLVGLIFQFFVWISSPDSNVEFHSAYDDVYIPNDIEDEGVTPFLGRKADSAKNSAGFFGRLFCKGGKQSFLCR